MLSEPQRPVPESHQVLDPRTLGRPVHLLGAFAKRCGADLTEALRLGLNRRYGTRFEVVHAAMRPECPPGPGKRWAVVDLPEGRLALSLDRRLVLQVLDCRYGPPAVPTSDERQSRPKTSTEERLAQKLALNWLALLAQRLRDGLAPVRAEPAQAALAQPQWLGEAGEPVGAWTLELGIQEPGDAGVGSVLLLSLDEAWMHLLLERLRARRPQVLDEADSVADPLASRLPLQLQVRLLSRRLTLGEVFDLRPGSVIPVSLQGTDVLVKYVRLFTATVAEHKGKLWLTAFNDIP